VRAAQRNECCLVERGLIGEALELRILLNIKCDDPWCVVGGRGHDARNGVGDIIMRVRSVVDRVAPGSTRPALKPKELYDRARVIEKVDAARVQHRQESEIDFALVLLRRLIRDSVCRESFPRPFACVSVSGHRRDAIGFQRLRELNNYAVRTERRLTLGDAIENRPIVLEVRDRERHRVA